jgi:anthranilate synthase component 2
VFLIDNYDSFTYNLFQFLSELGAAVAVHRNDRFELDQIQESGTDAIVISPGPGRPEGAGHSMAAIERYGGRIPILGVCLGHQAIGQVFGCSVVRAPALFHGKVSEIHHLGTGLFEGLPSPLTATRYHSLVLDPSTIPDLLCVTARTADGVVMGVRHRGAPIEGVQFHPESALTPTGKQLLRNFLDQVIRWDPSPATQPTERR